MYKRPRKFSWKYRLEKWFFSDHTKAIKQIIHFIGGLIMTLGFFGLLFIFPHFFH